MTKRLHKGIITYYLILPFYNSMSLSFYLYLLKIYKNEFLFMTKKCIFVTTQNHSKLRY